MGLILPFLGALTSPGKVYSITMFQPVYRYLGITSQEELLLPITILFIGAACVSGITRVFLLWITTRISQAIGADLSLDVYRKTLYQPLLVHTSRNSSEILTGTTKALQLVGAVIQPIFVILTSLMMIISVMALLVSLNPLIAIISLSFIGMFYWLIAFFTRKRIRRNGQIISREHTLLVKTQQEGLGGIRDVLLDGTQNIYSDIFKRSVNLSRRVYANNLMLAGSPRFIMEAIGMSFVALIALYSLQTSGDLTSSLPLLGALALGAQRMLPVLQKTYTSWSSIKAGEALLDETLVFLNQPLPDYTRLSASEVIPYRKQIKLTDVSFRYHDGPLILNKVNLTIPRGSRVGFIGPTGSGKSTLLDILMALLEPTEGAMEIDGEVIGRNNIRNWQMQVAHVPQSIYLSDNSMSENIAFGVPKSKIDMQKVKSAARQAQIADYIEGLDDGYDTVAGERGIRLSGGQRQRIGIARALYKEANVIVFDEATSALDNETEEAVMSAINKLGRDLTILIIAHRLTTVKNCDKIIELSKGKITKAGTYRELFGKS